MNENNTMEKLNRWRFSRMENFRGNYNDRVNNQGNIIEEKRDKILSLERVEAQLIERLRNSQQLEQQILGELESALNTSQSSTMLRIQKQGEVRKKKGPMIAKLGSNPGSPNMGSNLNGSGKKSSGNQQKM